MIQGQLYLRKALAVTSSSSDVPIIMAVHSHGNRTAGTALKGARHDPRRATAGVAGDGGEARGREGLGASRWRPEGGEPPGRHGRARPGRADAEDAVGTTPARRSALRRPLGMPRVTPVNPLWKWEQQWRRPHNNSSSSALASRRSAVSKPSVNQRQIVASRSSASSRWPYCCHRLLRLIVARSSSDLAS
jgi:hypothetical protein